MKFAVHETIASFMTGDTVRVIRVIDTTNSGVPTRYRDVDVELIGETNGVVDWSWTTLLYPVRLSQAFEGHDYIVGLDASCLQLIERGDLSRRFLQPYTLGSSVRKEAELLKSAGMTTRVSPPNGWTLGAIIAALELGVADGFSKMNWMGSVHHHVFKLAVPGDIGRRLAQETLEGFKGWQETFPDEVANYNRALKSLRRRAKAKPLTEPRFSNVFGRRVR
jgi:hypothetical protein